METDLRYLSQFHGKYFNLWWELIEQANTKAQNKNVYGPWNKKRVH